MAVLYVFVEISPNYFVEIDGNDMDYYIIEDDVGQSGYDGDVSFCTSTTMSEYTLDLSDSGFRNSPGSHSLPKFA